jgi:hypothetical protein
MATTGNYYINQLTGEIQQQSNPVLAIPYHVYPWKGPYATMAAAHAAINKSPNQSLNPAKLSQKVADTTLGPLFQKNLWVRVAEVLVGVVLVAIGLNAMLKGKPMSVVTKAAGTVGKAAILA